MSKNPIFLFKTHLLESNIIDILYKSMKNVKKPNIFFEKSIFRIQKSKILYKSMKNL